jgi:exosome complex RNA-binding protein Csl4
LCHVSEISDDHIENIEAKFGAGEKVNAIVLKVILVQGVGYFTALNIFTRRKLYAALYF